ncbi:hypothetical protein WJX73_004954 [Symbiochloris irregularis]|uniref:Uncharacterized protein n=1 Tax=Symbiochloris irregularis TaxID=706552 RepID=A0AAW1NVV1_9CHLO
MWGRLLEWLHQFSNPAASMVFDYRSFTVARTRLSGSVDNEGFLQLQEQDWLLELHLLCLSIRPHYRETWLRCCSSLGLPEESSEERP